MSVGPYLRNSSVHRWPSEAAVVQVVGCHVGCRTHDGSAAVSQAASQRNVGFHRPLHRLHAVSLDARIAEIPLYTYTQVDQILGLGSGTAKRWINGYERRGIAYEPVVRPQSEHTLRVKWGEFVEVYYLSRFRSSGIPLQRLRRTLQSVRERTRSHYLFADDKVLYADPSELEVIYEVQQAEGVASFLVKRTGQLRLEIDPEARRRLDRITYEDGVATALRPRLAMDHIVVHARRFYGHPKIAETGVSPSAVARLVRSGTPVDVVSELYDLDASIIDEAGRFAYGDLWIPAA